MHHFRASLQRALAAWLCVACLLLLPAGAFATQTLKTVRVGFFAFDGYHMQDAQGKRSGYGYDLLQRIAGYTDWQFEYVGYAKSWAEMQEMLANGEIDILTSAQKTQERMQRFNYSSNAIGTSSAILTVRAGDSRYAATDYIQWRDMRVGMLKDSSRNDDFAIYAASHSFWYTPVYYDTTDELVKALKTGEDIDAALTSNLRSIKDEWVLVEFDTSPFYAMVNKNNPALLREVDAAIDQLLSDDPMVLSSLMAQYYTPTSGNEISFTLEERAFIKDASQNGVVFSALINPDRAPYSAIKDGQAVGIISEIMREVVSRSGLQVNIEATDSREAYWSAAKTGAYDLRLDAGYDLSQAEAMGYRLTMPYLDANIVQLTKRDSKAIKSVALLQEGDISDSFERDALYEAVAIQRYSSLSEVVGAVLDGKQDAAYLYNACAEAAMQADETNRLVATASYGHDISFCVAVNAKQNHLLYSILNKAVNSLSDADIKAIVESYAKDPRDGYTFVGYLYNHPFAVVTGVLVIVAILGLVILTHWLSRKGKREKERLLKEEQRNEALSVSLATAERANASKSQFLSRVSHEMRTPLNGIIGFMALAKDATPTQAAEYMSNAETAAKQLLNVIHDVLDMSSIETGKMKLARSPFDFKHLVHALNNMYAAQCKQKGLDFETKLMTPVDEWLVGDQLRVNQVLVNLLGNALKFTSKGSVTLRISQQNAVNNSVFLRFEVIDTGCGMSEELMSRLFKPFEQENASTALSYGGSGLGLSIVKNLVSMMDGAITVQSARDVGSTFTVDLPFARCQAEPINACVSVDSPRILVVDDEASERKYLSTVLERIGMRFTCVESGSLALAELSHAQSVKDPYGICIVDWKMPDMSGMEVSMRIRERFGKDMLIIIESAYEHEDANDLACKAGANLYVPKPLFQSSLIDLLSTLTGGRVGAQTEHRPGKGELTGMHVLLAEDNAMNRCVATALMRRVGVICDEVENGEQAVTRFLESQPGSYDAILMDIQMPVMDGFEATRAIRGSADKHADAQSVQIIALTANAFNEDIAKTLASGMNAHVAKPIDPPALYAALERAYQEKQG